MKAIAVLIFLLMLAGSLTAQRNAGDLYPEDSIFFEYNTMPFVINGTFPSNCWQVGQPSKTYFNAAYSPDLAIVTDTINPYPVNTESSFTFMISHDNSWEWAAPYFEITHKYDTDTLADVGLIEYSFDNGTTWTLAKDSIGNNGPFGFYMFIWLENSSVLPPHHWGATPWQISGKSEGWIRSRYVWQFLFPVKSPNDTIMEIPDTILVRCTFRSDGNQTNKEGWMIDNIVTGWMDPGTGMADLSIPVNIAPNPMTDHTTIRTSPESGGASFNLYNASGKQVLTRYLDSNGNLIIYKNDLGPGVYLWKIRCGNRMSTGKLMVEDE